MARSGMLRQPSVDLADPAGAGTLARDIQRQVLNMGNHGTFQRSQVRKLLAATTISLIGCATAPSARAQLADTARSVVVNSGHVVGRFLEWRAGDTIRSVYEYNDRGRGPHLESWIHVGSDSIPDLLTIVGHAYLKDTVDERFARDRLTSRWKSTAFAGSTNSSVRAFYADATESPAANRLMIKVALANGGHLPLLPNGTLTVEPRGALTIRTATGPVHVTLYDVGGLGFSPYQEWLDENGSHFALVSSWTSIVPDGWERAIPEMIIGITVPEGVRASQLSRVEIIIPDNGN